MKAFRNLLVAVIALAAALPVLAQSIGRVLVASGEVTLVRGTATQPVTTGLALQAGDRVRTGAAGTAQLWFTDTSVVALRNGTEFVVEQYSYNNTAADNLVFNLVRGGFRTVAGLIGIKEQKSYVVKTRMATLGRRGTQYGIVYCERDCPLPEGGLAPDGLYGGVYEGRVGVINNTPEVQFARDQYFFVASIDSIPQPLLGPPSFLADRLTGLAKNAQKPAAEPPASKDTAASTEETRTAAAETPRANYTATENRTSSGAPSTLANAGPAIAALFSHGPSGNQIPGSGEAGFLQAGDYIATANANLPILTAVSVATTSLFSSGPFNPSIYSVGIGNGTVDMSGQNTTANVRWGRWLNGSLNDGRLTPNVQSPVGGIHFLYGIETTEAAIRSKTGTISFDDIGGTTPTLSNGVQATGFSFGQLTVDFTTRSANMGNSVIIFPNATITLFGNPNTAFNIRDNRGAWIESSLGAICTGTGCGSGPFNGYMRGIFFGVNADFVGLSINALINGSQSFANTVRLFGRTVTPPVALLVANSLLEANGSVGSYNFAAAVPASALTTSGTGPSQTLTAFNMNPLFTLSGAVGNSGIDMAGFDADSGVYYGRWINGTLTSGASLAPGVTPGTQTSGMGVHYMYGSPTPDGVIAAKTGSAQYFDHIGTYPTASNGETANAYAFGPININFTNRTGVITSAQFSFPSSSWNFSNLNFNISVTPGQGASFDANLINVGSCVGSGCGPVQGSNTARADFFGRFIGNSGNFLGVSFQGNSGGNTPSGNPNLTMGVVRVFKCPSCP